MVWSSGPFMTTSLDNQSKISEIYSLLDFAPPSLPGGCGLTAKRKELDYEKDRAKAKDISLEASCPSQLRTPGDLELEGGCPGFQVHLYHAFQFTHSRRERQMLPGSALQRGGKSP